MFSIPDNISDDDFEVRDPSGLSSIFDEKRDDNGSLVYRAPRQPGQFNNKEQKEEKNHELVGVVEPMFNIKPGVKMTTAVNAFRFENNGFKSEGKLGLAIIGNRESNFYQLLLYRGKQHPVAVANITTALKFKVQENNFANFLDDKNNSWTVGFDTEDLLVNFVKQFELCKTVFRYTDTLECDLKDGEGKEVGSGDSVEINLTGWSIEHQSLGPMVENVTGLKYKLGSPRGGGWESGLQGMRKGGRRFMIFHCPENSEISLAYDVQVTRTKCKDTQSLDKQSAPRESDSVPLEADPPRNIGSSVHSIAEDLENRGIGAALSRSAREGTNLKDQSLAGQKTAQYPLQGSIHTAPSSHPTFHYRQENGYDLSRQEMSILLSETRLSNTELRMNMTRMSDKVDELLKRSGDNPLLPARPSLMADSLDQLRLELDIIKSQTSDIIQRMTSVNLTPALDNGALELENFKVTRETLKEQEAELKELRQLKEEVKNHNIRLQESESVLYKQRLESRRELYTELKKVLGSTSKFLVSLFEKEQSYSGEDIQYTIAETLHSIAQKVEKKYSTQSEGSVSGGTLAHNSSADGLLKTPALINSAGGKIPGLSNSAGGQTLLKAHALITSEVGDAVRVVPINMVEQHHSHTSVDL